MCYLNEIEQVVRYKGEWRDVLQCGQALSLRFGYRVRQSTDWNLSSCLSLRSQIENYKGTFYGEISLLNTHGLWSKRDLSSFEPWYYPKDCQNW